MSYRRYAAERIAASVTLLFLAASLAWVLVHVVGPGGSKPTFVPGNMADLVRRINYVHYSHETYFGFLWRLVGHGSLGHTLTGIDLASQTFSVAPVTLSLAGGALLFALLTGVPLGFLLGSRRRMGRITAESLSNLALASWPLWVGLWLSAGLGYSLSAFPIAGYCNLLGGATGASCAGPVQWSYHLVLPSIALGLVLAAVYAGVTRRLVLAVSRSEEPDARRRAFVAFAKLAVRNASWLVGATFFIEVIFNLPGLGWQLLTGYNLGDPPTIEATLIVVTILAVGLSLAVDLVAGAFVPEWRLNEFQPRPFEPAPDVGPRAVAV